MLPFAGTLPMRRGECHSVGTREFRAIVIDGIGLNQRLASSPESALHASRRLGKLLVARPSCPWPEMAEGIE